MALTSLQFPVVVSIAAVLGEKLIRNSNAFLLNESDYMPPLVFVSRLCSLHKNCVTTRWLLPTHALADCAVLRVTSSSIIVYDVFLIAFGCLHVGVQYCSAQVGDFVYCFLAYQIIRERWFFPDEISSGSNRCLNYMGLGGQSALLVLSIKIMTEM